MKRETRLKIIQEFVEDTKNFTLFLIKIGAVYGICFVLWSFIACLSFHRLEDRVVFSFVLTMLSGIFIFYYEKVWRAFVEEFLFYMERKNNEK